MKTRPPWALLWLALAVVVIGGGLLLAIEGWPSPAPGPVWVTPSPTPFPSGWVEPTGGH